MSFKTFLSAIGHDVKVGVDFMLGKALPVATRVAVAAEPFLLIANPAIGAEFALVTNAVASIEAKYALSNAQSGTGPQKMQEVLALVQNDLLPKLTQVGLTNEAALAKVEAYIQAAVTAMNTFPLPAAPAPSSTVAS